MKNVSKDFKIKTKKVKQQDVKLTINSGELTVKDIHFMSVDVFNKLPVWMLRKKKQVIAKELKYSFEGKLFKTIMKQIEITVKNANEIKDKNINFKYGLYINNEYEYIDLGDYYIKDIEDNKSKDELTVTGYDKMLSFMKTFKQSELQLAYPCTLLTLVLKICEVCGVELYSTNFFNASLVVNEDYFTAQELTYRDVLEKITQATLTTAFIKDNKLYFCKIGDEIVDRLDKTYLTDLVIKEKFGPVNALVLGRGDVEDNIESKDDESISKNGRTEIRFDENEFVEYQREKVINDMFKQIKGLEYYSYEGSDLGVMWLEPCDLIELSDREENVYKSIYLNANITINTGITSDTGADLIEETNTEYKATTKEEKKTLKVERLAKKNEGLIQDIIQETSENSEKLTLHEQTIDSIKDTVSSIETNLEDNYSTTTEMNARIEEKAGEVTVKTEQKIESIQIGGTNLLQDSAFPSATKKWNIRTGVSIDTTNKMNANNSIKMDCSGSNRLDCPKEYFADYKQNEKLTLSVWLMCPDVSKITSDMNIGIEYRNASGTAIANNQLLVTPDMFAEAGNGSWFKVKITGNSTNANSTKCTFMCATNSTTGIVYISSPKLERGTKDTDWSFADGDVVKDIELGQKIEINWEHVKVAWNTICEYLQMENLKGNASLVVRDGDGKLIMSLDKTGQHYWTQKDNEDKNIAETTLKEITINNETKKALMFLLDNVEMNGEGIMAWGYKSGNNIYPVLYVGKFGDEEFGLHLATDLIAHANAIKFQNASIDDDGANLYLRTLGALKLMDTENNTWIGQIFKDEGNYGFSIKADDFTILNSVGKTPSLSMYENEAGSKTLDLFENYVVAGNIANMNNLKYMSGSTWEASGDKYGMLYCTLRDGQEFTITSYSAVSDERLKENIKSTKLNALERIKKINHIQFDWKNTKEHEEIGYIAQELEKIDKNYVFKIPNPKNDDMKYTVRELAILATTTKAVQELNEKVEKQEKIINKLLEKLNIKKEDLDA